MENYKNNTVTAKFKKKFWNSENNEVDGPYTPNNKFFDSGAPNWVQTQILNYYQARSTATIVCPLWHSWTLNYGYVVN